MAMVITTKAQKIMVLVKKKTNDCILGPGAPGVRGYGEVLHQGVRYSSHRFACIVAHGEPPTPWHEAAHKCHNRMCVNPRHLRWLTHQENILERGDGLEYTPEAIKARRVAYRARAKAERDALYLMIRKDSQAGISGYQLARKYRVGRNTVAAALKE